MLIDELVRRDGIGHVGDSNHICHATGPEPIVLRGGSGAARLQVTALRARRSFFVYLALLLERIAEHFLGFLGSAIVDGVRELELLFKQQVAEYFLNSTLAIFLVLFSATALRFGSDFALRLFFAWHKF